MGLIDKLKMHTIRDAKGWNNSYMCNGKEVDLTTYEDKIDRFCPYTKTKLIGNSIFTTQFLPLWKIK